MLIYGSSHFNKMPSTSRYLNDPRRPLTALEIQREIEKIMNADLVVSDYEPYEDSGSDWKDNNLEREIHNSSDDLDDDFLLEKAAPCKTRENYCNRY